MVGRWGKGRIRRHFPAKAPRRNGRINTARKRTSKISRVKKAKRITAWEIIHTLTTRDYLCTISLTIWWTTRVKVVLRTTKETQIAETTRATKIAKEEHLLDDERIGAARRIRRGGDFSTRKFDGNNSNDFDEHTKETNETERNESEERNEKSDEHKTENDNHDKIG